MSSEEVTEQAAETPVHESLRDFVESAMADTPGLSDGHRQEIRERCAYWFKYYGRTLPWLKLDFADTEETRWNAQYFRETLRDYLTTWNSIEHVYYACEMVMVGTLQEHTRLAIEERLGRERAAQQAMDACTVEKSTEPADLPLVATRQPTPARAPRRRAETPPPPEANPPTEQQVFEQFGLFG